MNITIALLLITISAQARCFSQSFTWGKTNDGSTKTIDICVIALKTNPEECGDCDGMKWTGISAGYEINDKRFYTLYSAGILSFAQVFGGIGPEVNTKGFREVGIRLKAMFVPLVFPIALSCSPSYNFDKHKSHVRFEISYGFGVAFPLLGNPASRW